VKAVSPVVPVDEASFNLSGPAGQWLAGTRPKSMWQGFHCRPNERAVGLSSVLPAATMWL